VTSQITAVLSPKMDVLCPDKIPNSVASDTHKTEVFAPQFKPILGSITKIGHFKQFSVAGRETLGREKRKGSCQPAQFH
jgi:hypothetical protein